MKSLLLILGLMAGEPLAVLNSDLYITNKAPDYGVYFPTNEASTIVWWEIPSETVRLTISTNISTNWFSTGSFDIGQRQTNRMLRVVHLGATNDILIAVIGKEPMLTRTNVGEIVIWNPKTIKSYPVLTQ